MKNNFVIAFFLTISLVFPGCKKYLDLPPKNKLTVTTIADVKSLLASYLNGIATKYVQPIYGTVVPLAPTEGMLLFEAYADNIDFERALNQTYLQPNNAYKKEADYADYLLWNQYTTPGLLWSNHYEVIGFMNALINQMDKVTDATLQERDRLLGEMYVHRAWYFFKLLQYFAPYNNASLGIPVYLKTGESVVGIQTPRSSQADVYKVILDDLNNTAEMLARTSPVQEYNILFSKRYINHLMAQVYWFKAESAAKEASDYEKVKNFSIAALDNVDGFIPNTAQGIRDAFAGKIASYPAVCMENNLQGFISMLYGSEFEYFLPGMYGPENIPLSAEFCNLFEQTDVRIATYFNTNPARAGGNTGIAGKTLAWHWPTDGTVDGNVKRGNVCLFKPEEAYLMLAEAYYRLNDNVNSIATLNKFKAFRNAGSISTGLSGPQLLTEIINERRKEFFADYDKRWLDLKRFGNKTITRNLLFFQKPYTITVPPNDFRYALPIPLVEMQHNKNMVPNDGWVILQY